MAAIAIAGGLAACTVLGGLSACAGPSSQEQARSSNTHSSHRISTDPTRRLSNPLYGITVDDVTHIQRIVAGVRLLPETPTTRIYFDVKRPAQYYAAAVNALRPVSYLLGELLDSSDEAHISTSAFNARVNSYLAAFGSKVDLWEIGNEVNGNWTGRYPVVRAKLTEAYRDVTDAGKRTALTLYYNIGCGHGRAEIDPLTFSRSYVPAAVRDGLDYVLLSYYPDDCNGIRPDAATWTAYFRQLHALYPHALLGFGEVGMDNPATAKTLSDAESLMRYSYGMAVPLPYYVGGSFWWYFAEDCLPYTNKVLWGALRGGLRAEAATLARRQR